MSLLAPDAEIPSWIPTRYYHMRGPRGGYYPSQDIKEICAEMRYLESLGNWHNLEPETVAFNRYGASVAKLAGAILNNTDGILDSSFKVTEAQPVMFDALAHLCMISFDGVPLARQDRIMRMYAAVQRVRTLSNYFNAVSNN